MRKRDEHDILFDESKYEQHAFVQVSQFVLYDPRLKSQHLNLYMLLKNFAFSGKKFCFPGIKRLAADMQCTERTIYTCMDTLEKCDLLTRKRRKGTTTLYTLHSISSVYFESLNPPVLKKWFVESLYERGESQVDSFEKIIGDDIPNPNDSVAEHEEEENKVKETESEEQRVNKKLKARKRGHAASMLSTVEDMDEKAQSARARTAENRKKKKKYGGKTMVSTDDPSSLDDDLFQKPLTTRDVEAVWIDTLRTTGLSERFPDCDKRWSGVEAGISKRLITVHTVEKLIFCIDHILKHWDEYVDRYNVRGAPNMKSISYWADTWFPEIESGKKSDPTSKRDKALMQGEYRDGDKGRKKGGGGVSFL